MDNLVPKLKWPLQPLLLARNFMLILLFFFNTFWANFHACDSSLVIIFIKLSNNPLQGDKLDLPHILEYIRAKLSNYHKDTTNLKSQGYSLLIQGS